MKKIFVAACILIVPVEISVASSCPNHNTIVISNGSYSIRVNSPVSGAQRLEIDITNETANETYSFQMLKK